jgi:hypothetical protein
VEHAENNFRSCHGGAGVAGCDESRGVTIAHEAQSHANGGVALGANGLRGFVIHGDDLAGVNDFDGKAGGAWITAEAGLDLFLRADQEHAHAKMTCGLQCALQFWLGRPVRPHRIQGYGAGHEGKKLGFFFD